MDLYNEYFFRSLDDVEVFCTLLTYDGTRMNEQSETIRYPINLAPQQREHFTLPAEMTSYLKNAIANSIWAAINVQFRLKADRGLLKKGAVIAKAQFELKPYTFPTAQSILDSVRDGSSVSSSAVAKDEAKSWLTLSAAGVSVTWNKWTGNIDYYDIDGTPVLEDRKSVEPSFWRAPTDNDYGAQLQNKLGAWKNARWNKRAMDCTQLENQSQQVVVKYHSDALDADLTVTYILTPKGDLIVTEALDVNESAERKPQMMVNMS